MNENEEDRRKFDRDHDLLVEVHSLLKNVDSNFREHKKEFTEHKGEDNQHFSRIYGMIGSLKWYVAIGVGIVLTIQFVFVKAVIH